MTGEERQQFERNRTALVNDAMASYGVEMFVNGGDRLVVSYGRLADVVNFYRDYRSEIEGFI